MSTGPVTLSTEMKQLLERGYHKSPEFSPRLKDIALIPEDLQSEWDDLLEDWGEYYAIRDLVELDGVGLSTHMNAGDLPIGQRFTREGDIDGRYYRRISNPFGENIVDGNIAAIELNSPQTILIHEFEVVRPVNIQKNEDQDNLIKSCIPTKEEAEESAVNWEKYVEASDKIESRVDNYVRKKCKSPQLMYSAYEVDEEGTPKDNLGEVAVKGKCVIHSSCGLYQTPELENPTWLELCHYFNESLLETGDTHHIFFEGVHKSKGKYFFSSGS